jgi:hypothetical protein
VRCELPVRAVRDARAQRGARARATQALGAVCASRSQQNRHDWRGSMMQTMPRAMPALFSCSFVNVSSWTQCPSSLSPPPGRL